MSAQLSSPIAIVGIAFRFPGDITDDHDFWQALIGGHDLVGEVDSARWATDMLQHSKRSEPGRSITFSAGVLSRIDEFDAGFFGISPREAAWLDPQQRLLLELSWEAMENAGVVPSTLAGSDCSVFVGISSLDYGARAFDDLASISSHFMTGNTLSIAANRLSYVYDLHGPSMAVDTACSSSMVALHLACNALRNGESSMAMVGGVNILMHAYPFVGFTKASMLSADGRCRAFDASGEGYVRAEGGAVLLLKPLPQAIADGDTIEAVILGTGANADGSRKTGITIPSVDGQVELMRSVLRRTGIAADEVDYVEAHGTGTVVGDPVEAAAIGAVYGQVRRDGDCLPIGSVKTNLGHLESASGMAGLVKTVLALKHRMVPPSRNLDKPNPNIDFAHLNIQVATQPISLAADRPLVAGVNSFGFGGANAHVLLQEYRPVALALPTEYAAFASDSDSVGSVAAPLFLSAKTPVALRAQARQYANHLRQVDAGAYYAIAHGATFRREWLEHRLVVRGESAQAIAKVLDNFADEADTNIVLEKALEADDGIAFIYSGNGAQWLGMGRQLLAESPRFVQIFADMEPGVRSLSGFSLTDELLADGAASRLADTAVAQPLMFAIQVGVTLLLRDLGIVPCAVSGHSVGEVAAAWAAGILDLPEAIKVICIRSTTQALMRGTGRMAAVGLGEVALRELLQSEGFDDLEIGAVNSPKDTTVSGDLVELQQLGDCLAVRGIFFRLLDLDYAFHSRRMNPIETSLLDKLSVLQVRPASTRFISTVTGSELVGTELGASYWWRNVRQPVRFDAAVAQLVAHGCRVFVEIGSNAILQRYLSNCLRAAEISDTASRVLPTLRRNDDGLPRIEEAALRVHLLSTKADHCALLPVATTRVRLPNYPWQRERHWFARSSEAYPLIERRRVHPLLGWRLTEGEAIWENILDLATMPWLADHKVSGAVVLPGAVYAEIALAASREWFGGDTCELEQIDIIAPMVFDEDHARTIRFEIAPRDGSFVIRSRQRLSEDEWTLNTSGRLLGATSGVVAPAMSPLTGNVVAVAADQHYQRTAALGLDYSGAFRRFDNGVVAGMRLDASFRAFDGERTGMLLDPAIVDVCFQALSNFFVDEIDAGRGAPLLPIKIGRLVYFGGVPTALRTQLLRCSARSVLADFDLIDANGRLVARLSHCRFRAATLKNGQKAPARWQHVARVQPHPVDSSSVTWLASEELCSVLTEHFVQHGDEDRAYWFQQALPLLEALSLSYGYRALCRLSVHGTQRLSDVLHHGEGIAPSMLPWLRWIASHLQQEGLLEVRNDVWNVLADNPLPPPEDIWRTLMVEFPQCLPELVQIGRLGEQLETLLVDAAQANIIGAEMQRSPIVSARFETSPAYAGTRIALIELIRRFVAELPAEQRLRILEISAGVSDMPRLLSLAEGVKSHVDYVLATDDAELLSRLQAEYRDDAFVVIAEIEGSKWRLCANISLPDKFDLIILNHCVHVQSDPRAALIEVRSKLVVGGLLVLAERHPDLCADFVGGIDPHWWHTSSQSRLQSAATWSDILEALSYNDVRVWHEPSADGRVDGAYLVLAKQTTKVDERQALEAHRWLLLEDVAGSCAMIHDQLAARGAPVIAIMIDPTDSRGVAAAIATASHSLGGVTQLVYRGTSASACTGLLHVVQNISAADLPPRLWILTSGGALFSGIDVYQPQPDQAALTGFGRVVANEHPGLRCTMIDVGDVAGQARRIANELLYPDGETEIVLTSNGRCVPRMVKMLAASGSVLTPSDRFRLDFHVPGQLRNLVWLNNPSRALQAGEVEVRIAATGLNFRDVMYLMGLLPDEAVENGFAGTSLGLEFAGTITRVGAGVIDFVVGDAVMGFGAHCFSSHIVTQTSAIAKKPAQWSFASSAAVPTVFFTVYYALQHLAAVQPGERVLIHGAAGGVGIAAIQLARHLGAEVFATAGSEDKRIFVHLLGADHIFDSRSLDYADAILTATDGEGVDVVLNSLAGEAIRRNLQILRPFGRFLELGKRDFFENTPIGLRPFKDNISYFGIDADQLLVARPVLASRLFRDVMALFEAGVLTPLPCRVFPAQRVVDAFRAMQQSRHIGKIVVDMSDTTIQVEAASVLSKSLQLSKDGSYLVAGGIGGFGLESARRLAVCGAGHLILLGRRGMDTPGAEQAKQELEALGAHVHVMNCDITDRQAVADVLSHIAATMPPLKGVLHAAMVLDDALIAQLDASQLQQVLAPKLVGAWHLHELTKALLLEHFVLYSSITTSIGNPGQANYVAANAYLESLAMARRSQGLPATCIAWGPIGDAGYLTRNRSVKESLSSRLGVAPLSSVTAVEMLEQVLKNSPEDRVPVSSVADFDWHTLVRILPSAEAPRFVELRRDAGNGAIASDSDGDFASQIAGKSITEVTDIIRELVRLEVAQILCIGVERIEGHTSLHELGMDSLMAIELAIGLEKRFGIQLSVMVLNEGPTVERVTVRIVEKISGLTSEIGGADENLLESRISALVKQHGEALSADELAGTVASVQRLTQNDCSV